MDNNPEDCPVCLTAFDHTLQRPRNLPCGHTFCTVCINALKKLGQVTCPTCRIQHTVPEAGHFPISYTLEAVIKRMKDTAVASTSPPPCAGKDAAKVGTPGQEEAAGLSRSMHSLVQEHKAKVMATITAFQEMQSQLDQYQTTLVGWRDKQQQFEDELQAVIDDSRSARVLVRQEESQVAAKKEQIQQGLQKLHDVLETLRKISTEQEVGVAVVDVVRCTHESEERVEECQELFPDVHTVTTAWKVREASKACVEAFKSMYAALETTRVPAGAAGSERNLQVAPASTILDRLQVLQTLTLKAEDLRTLTQPARILLQAGLVFATHKTEGRSRHARISLEDGRLYLHSLQDQTLPSNAVTLQMDELVPAASTCQVYLDLTWPGSASRRVIIRLCLDTPMGRQFVLLCTGQRGPSYVNTRLWEVVNKGQPGEYVYGGDYENNDGTGGAALLPDLDKGKYRESGVAGSVCRVCRRRGDKSVWNARFGINTRDCQDGVVARGVFGEVVDGLEGVAAAAQHSNIKEVTVVDCGVVLWQ